MRRRKPDSGATPNGSLTLDLQFAGNISIAPLRSARLRQLVKASIDHAAAQSETGRSLAELTLRFVARAEARRLNSAYRNAQYAPNVLTFDYPDFAAADIVICPPVVREQANEQHKSYADHLSHMIVHGVLHALGHTHERPTPARRMERLEQAILAQFSIEDPYIVSANALQAG